MTAQLPYGFSYCIRGKGKTPYYAWFSTEKARDDAMKEKKQDPQYYGIKKRGK